MGAGQGRFDELDPVLNMTARQKRTIQESWAKVMKFKTEVGAGIMITLFVKYPEYKEMFPFKEIPDDQLRQNMKFKLHCSNVLYSLGQIVDNLDNTELVIALLDRLALNHRKHGIPKTGFLNILSIIEDALRPISSNEEMDLWSKLLSLALNYATDKMNEHLNENGEEIED